MKINSFEDLVVWQKSRLFNRQIYETFSNLRDRGFKDQICRASVSISNNIAEGFEKKTNKEFKNFLYIAKGSAGEVRSMIYLAYDLKYLSQKKYESLMSDITEISKMLAGLIKTL